MATDLRPDPDLEWLDHAERIGLVVAPTLLKELGLAPIRQSPADSGVVAELIEADRDRPALRDPWRFLERVLGWEARHVAGAPGGPALDLALTVRLPEHDTTLEPSLAVAAPGTGEARWQLLVRIEGKGVKPDARGALAGWEATPQQRFERLLRDTGVLAGLMVTGHEIRLTYAPRGETSGHLTFPLRPLAAVAGRPMLAGLKLLLDSAALFTNPESHRLPALLQKSREAQAEVSTALAEQVLGALHELLRGLDAADRKLIRALAKDRPGHVYEGLLAVMMRLVFVLYAEDRDLLPSRQDARSRELYEAGYSVRGLYARLVEDAALNPDTMDERRGGWGRLLALFRMIHGGRRGLVQARGGKLFDPDEFPFLEGRAAKDDPARVLPVSDGCLLRILEGLMTVKLRGQARERLSYRSLDVEQIGSVYETVMGFTVEPAEGRVLAIKAGKNNRTPVFVDLDQLLARKGKDRLKELRETAKRGQLNTAQAKGIEQAKTIEALAEALEGIADERGSPHSALAGVSTPLLQPTDERRRTGSHYTPRSLTKPIVEHALAPAFERLGEGATPEQVLDLKVCDPAMGSGAFLVEACRLLADRLVLAWDRHKCRPTLPPDEDAELHARRLVAQRCLYGVDRNPRAVDLAKLSLWLATLARDHEFGFLDHALKCGDSLVGLSPEQIAAAHWDTTKAALPLFALQVKEKVAEALKGRAEIQAAPDDTLRAIQEARHRTLEGRVAPVRAMGDAVIAAFFSAEKPKAREAKRNEVESWVLGSVDALWRKLDASAASLRRRDQPVLPFHWQIEFPEVFARDNGGFDAIVGNPPFAGKNTIIASNAVHYLPWLQTIHADAHGNADLVAHFFRRAFGLLRQGGTFGLIATNTISQGDTRASGLAPILAAGGCIIRATRRLKWPGEAAVVVSVVHVARGPTARIVLDGDSARRISAYLVDGELDGDPSPLVANAGKAFQGSILLGMGFAFDDAAAAKGIASSIEDMRQLIARDSRNAERIFPYIGGDEVNTDPQHRHHRFAIDFFDRPLGRRSDIKRWSGMSPIERSECLRRGLVPEDYEGEVAEDWPDLLEIVRRLVKPERDSNPRRSRRERWWQYAEKSSGLYRAIHDLPFVLATSSKASPQYALAVLPNGLIYSQNLNVFALSSMSSFSTLQSRVHEAWARFFGTTFEDRLTYVVEDCLKSFPFPDSFEEETALEEIGATYHAARAALMVERDEGLTKTYNRFHDHRESSPDIARLRELHAEMDAAVLGAYGWDDLESRVTTEFTEQAADDGKTPKTRLDWPQDFKDEVLARLLVLNAERAAEERAAGLTMAPDEDETEAEEEGDA